MKLPLSLLKSFLQADLTVTKISETLTLLGIEVDKIYNEKPSFANVVVAEVMACSPHPSADRLQVTQVSDGKSVRTVVCGAANCRTGLRVALAVPGAVLTGSDGKVFRIEETKLRGVASAGMLCSRDELQLPGDSEGIIELPKEMELGTDLTSILWDPVFELSLTPNLGHCFSAIGIARDLAAALQLPLHIPRVHFAESEYRTIENHVSATCETPHCSRYMGRWIDDVQIAPSPFWLQQLLFSAGMKPISNAVDIANYMLLKWGQPMHAFDGDKIEGKQVFISDCKEPTRFDCLDGVQKEVPPGTIVISNGKKILAAAGIIGGASSAVSTNTRKIFLEAAVFDPIVIRKGARKMGVRTDSSQHFEKGVDPIGCEAALEEAAYWMGELTQGKVAKGKIDLNRKILTPKKVSCRIDRINQLIGIDLSQSEIESIFHRLGLKTEGSGNQIQVEIPLFRNDISEEIDLVEEVARIYGYNNIPKETHSCTNSKFPHDPTYLFENEMRQSCAALGLQEFLNADLISPFAAEIAKDHTQTSVNLLKATYTKSEEYSILRPSLLPGLLTVAKHNFDRKNFTLSGFEIGRIYFLNGDEAIEAPMGGLLLTGKKTSDHWSHKGNEYDFYDLKGIIENLLSDLQISKPQFQASNHVSFHPGRQADLFLGEERIGSLGEVHPSLIEKLGIEQRILYAELNLEIMRKLQKKQVQMFPLPQFPASERDWTVFLPLDTKIDTLFAKIQAAKPLLLEQVELIGLYFPDQAEQKNATFRFTYRDPYKTISSEEVETAHHKLLAEITSAR